MDFIKGGIVVDYGSESSPVSEVKGNKYQDYIFMDLKANIHKKRVLAFEQE